LLAEIISHQLPAIDEVITRKIRFASSRAGDSHLDYAQVEDIRGDALLQLVALLRRSKERPQEVVIGNLRAYVATVTTHACQRYFRRKYPQRHILKNRLRYLLTNQNGFGLWEAESGDLTAGYCVWSNMRAVSNLEKLGRLASQPSVFIPAELLAQDVRGDRLAHLLSSLFNYLGGPIAIDDLVRVVAGLLGLEDHEPSVEDSLALLPDSSAGADVTLESREYLRRLWAEIEQLPVRQRIALLLNLRDGEGRGCIVLLPLTGIASMRQIADALEIPAAELAELWGRLPLDDAGIAARIQLTRQQVINLRYSARARLARRLRGFG
jgi:DNA-directed RNA polymerase specialized sigma24 family protein